MRNVSQDLRESPKCFRAFLRDEDEIVKLVTFLLDNIYITVIVITLMTKTKYHYELVTLFFLAFYTGYLSNQLKIWYLPFCSIINGGLKISRMTILSLYMYVVAFLISWKFDLCCCWDQAVYSKFLRLFLLLSIPNLIFSGSSYGWTYCEVRLFHYKIPHYIF